MSEGKVVAVCVSAGSGLPRPQVQEGLLRVGVGFVGNKHSVGGQREICLFDQETYDALRAEGIAIGPGSFGENLTLSGIAFDTLEAGDCLKLGAEAVIEITIPRKGCANLKQLDERLPDAIAGRSGWMASVVTGGGIRPGDNIERIGSGG